jgi:hypothetical protein
VERIFFDGWLGLFRTFVIGVFAYAFIFALRASGKHTLSKMNAFDLVVTVALGLSLATVLLSKDVTLAEGALALALLIGLQSAVTWSSVGRDGFSRSSGGSHHCCCTRGILAGGPAARTGNGGRGPGSGAWRGVGDLGGREGGRE